MFPRSIKRLNGDCSGRVGILGRVWSVEKNLNVVRVMLIIAMWLRKSLIKVWYMFFEAFLSLVCHQQSWQWVLTG